MPANLTPDYRRAEERFRSASSPREEVEALEDMLRAIPKHKGTEKLQADIKRRLSEARSEKKSRKKSGRRSVGYHVDPGGYPQVVLLGPPNSGRSALVAALTNAEPKVAAYPYTTRVPGPAMLPFENTKIQLVDLPAISSEYMEPWVPNVARPANMALVVLDAASPRLLEDYEDLVAILEGAHLRLLPPGAPSTLEEDDFSTVELPALVLGNKCDVPGARGSFDTLYELLELPLPRRAVSARTGDGLDGLAAELFRALDVVRAYTKPPGKPADMEDPIVLPRGSTVRDFAAQIHRDLAEKLRSARIWSDGTPDGIWVQRDYELQDGDVIEIET